MQDWQEPIAHQRRYVASLFIHITYSLTNVCRSDSSVAIATEKPILDIPEQVVEFENLGTTIEVIVNGTTKFGGTDFRLKQFHMHTPSEHRVNDEYYPLEVHMVHEGVSKFSPSRIYPSYPHELNPILSNTSLTFHPRRSQCLGRHLCAFPAYNRRREPPPQRSTTASRCYCFPRNQNRNRVP
jgi:hypothetical protein